MIPKRISWPRTMKRTESRDQIIIATHRAWPTRTMSSRANSIPGRPAPTLTGSIMYALDPCPRTMPVDPFPLAEIYRRYYLSQGLFVESPHASGSGPGQLRLELAAGSGNGWTELVHIDRGLNVGMCDYELFRPVEGDHFSVGGMVCFNLLMSGEFEVVMPENGGREVIRGGELWLCHDFSTCIRYSQPSHRVIRGMSITLPRSMVEAWLGDPNCGMSQSLEIILRNKNLPNASPFQGGRPLSRCPRQTAPLVSTAARLLATKRDTVCGRLHFESLALNLLAQILGLEYPARIQEAIRSTPAIDNAIDILRAEWADPPTIAALARRIGLNECYLKAGFRRRTGQSIGEFVRALRMEHAMELIESGRSSILQAAMAVGYSNPSHFSSAFKRHHGRLPSSYLARP
ncbi:MAG: AraC family transcriptional regulator [Deltaproteobacteria bacterium]|nr:AraC family transcriptional regulator [Deltaproteobacteria bacterium]